MDFYKEIKTSSFTVLLPQKVTLSGKWNVALAEIHYNYNFFNVTASNNRTYLRKINKKNADDSENFITKELQKITAVPPGYYPRISCVASEINHELKKILNSSEDILTFSEFNGRTKIASDKLRSCDYSEMHFDDRLSMQLGFQPRDNILDREISPHAANIHFGIADQMLIYIDIIEPTFIGHEMAYVLKIVNTQPRSLTFGNACYKEFHKMHYMPVQKREFESISVDIRDYNGNFMPFIHGILTIKLHFKKQDG